MAYPRELDLESTREEIVKIMKKNIQQKSLLVAERTQLLETKQDPNESIIQYVHRLKEASKYCE